MLRAMRARRWWLPIGPTLALAACSFIGARSTPTADRAGPCASYFVPTIDAVVAAGIAVFATARAVDAAQPAPSGDPFHGGLKVYEAGAAAGLYLIDLVPFSSAIYGYVVIHRCHRSLARRETRQRQQAASRRALPSFSR